MTGGEPNIFPNGEMNVLGLGSYCVMYTLLKLTTVLGRFIFLDQQSKTLR